MENTKLRVLSCMADVIRQNGFRTEYFDGSDGNPAMTRIELPKQGKIRQDVVIDLWFPPAKMAREETALFQMHATIFQIDADAIRANLPELKRAIFYSNNFCTIGQFGLYEEDGVVYMRHNIVLNMQDDLERMVTDICDYFSLLLTGIQRFVDALAQIAAGAANMEVAKEMDLLPNL
ncbi:MAG TPA: hypothetical protein DDX51_05000 [Clostridiales bacterium]|nr:hypothetical protein [Clostridiales bacterium]